MPEDFSEISNQSIWALVQYIVAIVDVLKNELPFDYLTPSWHIEDGTDDFTVGVSGRWGERYHHLNIYTHYLDATPEPKEIYPPDCCALGTLQISSSEPLPPDALEVCGTPERWMVHHNGKWVPLSASYVAFLMGLNRSQASVR
jgi:hypothetical protein